MPGVTFRYCTQGFRPTTMSSGNLWIPLGIFIVFLEPPLAGMSIPVAVKIRDTAVLSCNKTCNGDFSWTFKPANNEHLEVLKCVQGDCTEGDRFKRRASPSGEMIHGILSLTLHPALYNDEGWYEATCDSVFLCMVHLEVFVPTTVNASIQDDVILPCYARTEKHIADGAVNILWKRGDQTVLEVRNGIAHYGSDFTKRASVSLNHYRNGDLSLTISRVTTSDNGLYRCYHKTEEHGHPGAVTLTVTAHQSTHEKKVGDDLTLDLFSTDQATVTFISSEGAEMPICRVEGSMCTCDPKYNERVSVINDSLVLSGLSFSDTGKFTVKDKMGKIMSVCTVNVEGVEQRHHIFLFTVIAVALALICIGLFLLCQYRRRPQQQLTHVYLGSPTSTTEIDTTPLREPANIGLSQEETGPDIPENVPHTPVEETRPNEKQNTSEEEFNILLETE